MWQEFTWMHTQIKINEAEVRALICFVQGYTGAIIGCPNASEGIWMDIDKCIIAMIDFLLWWKQNYAKQNIEYIVCAPQ